MPELNVDRDGQWDRISAMFEMVLSLPSHERTTFLDATCGSDHDMRGELESLIAAHDGAPAFLGALYTSVVHPVLAQDDGTGDVDGDPEEVAIGYRVASGDTIRHFTVCERVGSGGAGVVYRGRDMLLQRDVAMKFLAPRLSADPAARARLVREAQAASRLDDPHVCAIYAVEATHDGGLCIVMAYCAGGTLRERLRRGPMTTTDVETVTLHLARGLASAHQAGIVHGDIKPANVGFGDGDVARLLDFGVAVHAGDATTGGRAISGTMPYLAPELWRGGAHGPGSDVWALGVTFFEMVTGRRPFIGADPGTLADAILGGVVPPLTRPDATDIRPGLAALITRMLSAHPSRRPADGAAVLAELSAVLQEPTEARQATRLESDTRADRPKARVRTRWTVLAAGAVALAAAAWLYRLPSSPRTAAPPQIEVARTSAPLPSIAVLPFTTRGSRDIAYLADGMVDLLTPTFDGTGLVRGIDPNTVITAAGADRNTTLDSASSRALAVKVGADRYVVGSIVATGPVLSFRATLRMSDGREVGRAQTTVSDSAGLVGGIQVLVRQLIASELRAPGDTVAGIAAATTSSITALRAFLDGERELRDARPVAAVARFQAAVSADSTFALAWYRLARAARWSAVDSLSASAAQRASALSASLPPRQQTLVTAYHTMRFGSPWEAERLLSQIVTDYPTDVEAWMLLGEVQFGSNPYHGRPIALAATAFERVMALDPRNREVTVYLMDLAALANRTGQLDTLYSMYFSPNSAGEQPGIRAAYTALHRRRVGTRSRVDAVLPGTLRDESLARVALDRMSPDARDRDAARQLAGVLAASVASRVEGLLSLAMLDAADGKWGVVASQIGAAATLDADRAAEVHALSALAPSIALGADTIIAIRSALQDRRSTATASSSGLANRARSHGALSAAEADDIRQYLIGMLSVRLDDAAAYTAAQGALARRPATESRVAASLSHAVTAHWQLRRNNLPAAIAAFERSIPDIPARLRAQHPVLQQHLDRLARATTLRRLGRGAEAQPWYQSLQEGAGVAGVAFVAAADSGLRAVASP